MRWLAASCATLIVLSASAMANTDFPSPLTPIDFADLTGWADDDHDAALVAFRRTCETATQRAPRSRSSSVDGQALAAICEDLAQNPPSSARVFFEDHFAPLRVLNRS